MRAILESADRWRGLIDNILDLAISDAGALELDIQPVEVKALVDAAVAAKADMLAEKQLDLNVRVRANAGRIECDERRLSASLHHLLSNRSEKRRVGKRCVCTCKSSGSPYV